MYEWHLTLQVLYNNIHLYTVCALTLCTICVQHMTCREPIQKSVQN